METNKPPANPDSELRPHVFDDNIREYDNRLPNWWLWTLYGAIIFSFVYWSFYHHWNADSAREPGVALTHTIQENQLLAARSSGTLSDEQLWQMSHDASVTIVGRATFESTCASCHNPDLSGKIGPNLKDEVWLHGGAPHEIITTITNGVPVKGMPTWGPILGRTKISEVAAYILSYHQPPAGNALPQ